MTMTLADAIMTDVFADTFTTVEDIEVWTPETEDNEVR